MSWRDTQYEDLHRIVLPGESSGADARDLYPDTEESRAILFRDAWTWEDPHDGILAIVGISCMWKGVGVVWTLLTDKSRQRGVALTRGVLRLLGLLHRERGYWRIQATVERGDETARLWIIHLGFVYEGTMVAYGPDGETHDMYARVRG